MWPLAVEVDTFGNPHPRATGPDLVTAPESAQAVGRPYGSEPHHSPTRVRKCTHHMLDSTLWMCIPVTR
jgi:hypothetical protein